MNELEKFLRADYEKWKDLPYLHEMVNGRYEGITMGEFIEKVNYLGTYFVNNGYKGKNIGIYSPNSIAWMIADVAIMNYVGLSVGLAKAMRGIISIMLSANARSHPTAAGGQSQSA